MSQIDPGVRDDAPDDLQVARASGRALKTGADQLPVGGRWQLGQLNDERFMKGSRRIGVPQRGQGRPPVRMSRANSRTVTNFVGMRTVQRPTTSGPSHPRPSNSEWDADRLVTVRWR